MAHPRRGCCRQRLAVGRFQPPWAVCIARASLAHSGPRHGAATVLRCAGLLRGGLLAHRFGGAGLLGGTLRRDGLVSMGSCVAGVVHTLGSAAWTRRVACRAAAHGPAAAGRDRMALPDECCGCAVPWWRMGGGDRPAAARRALACGGERSCGRADRHRGCVGRQYRHESAGRGFPARTHAPRLGGRANACTPRGWKYPRVDSEQPAHHRSRATARRRRAGRGVSRGGSAGLVRRHQGAVRCCGAARAGLAARRADEWARCRGAGQTRGRRSGSRGTGCWPAAGRRLAAVEPTHLASCLVAARVCA